jgi:hypothetical protein
VDNLEYVLRDLDEASSFTLATGSTGGEDDPTKAEDHDTQRIRSFLKRTVLLTKEAQEEIAKRTEYLRMLKRHYESTASLRRLMRGLRLDDWFWMCERWRARARQYYKPLSARQCDRIVQEALQAIQTHNLPDDTTGIDAFAWHDSVRLDDDERCVRFRLRKTLTNVDMKQLVDHTWTLYQDSDLYKEGHLGDNCELFHETLQHISPDTVIIQRVERYPNLKQLTHSLAIIFRVQTETGYMIVIRCIESPRLQSFMKADGLSLGGTFAWDSFDVGLRDARGEGGAIQFTTTGTIVSDDPTYAKRWCDELLIALLRYEIQLKDEPILPVDVEDGDGQAIHVPSE